MFASLFPPPIAVSEIGIDPQLDLTGERHLFPEETTSIANAIGKRRREFIAGRICARRALAALGFAESPIPPQADRSPNWPRGAIGSITHTTNLAAAAVAISTQIRALGMDMEEVDRITADLHPRLFNAVEVDQLRCFPAARFQELAAVLFSAKEAFFKCQFPHTRAFVGFHEAFVTLNADAGTFEVVVPTNPEVRRAHLNHVSGRFAVRDGLVFTGVWLAASPIL